MKDAVDRIARRSAESFGPEVSAELERVLLTGGAPAGQRYVDLSTAAAIAGLIVSVAQLAWSVYSDRRKAGAAPGASDVERRVRLKVEAEIHVSLPPARRDEVIARVVATVIADQEDPR